MSTAARSTARLFVCSFAIVLVAAGSAAAQGYAALQGAREIKTVFDVRQGDAARLSRYLGLIRQTLADPAITAVPGSPDFRVVFHGTSVRLISRSREGVSAEDARVMDQIAETVSAMAKDGITMEVCRIALASANVDPASVLPGITPVGNGWISLLGYQGSGYSLIVLP